MIQRFQTLLLAVVVIAMATVIGTPIWQKSSAALNQKVVLTASALEHSQATTVLSSQSNIYIAVLAGIAALVAIVSISQYKKRVLQMTLGAINSALMALVLILSFYHIFQIGIPMFEPENQGAYSTGFYAAVVGLLANMIANRFIRRDETLVRSADRMR
jgi:glucan phosphoethanolaminetransferase (alkaline phosphatase superfamily)